MKTLALLLPLLLVSPSCHLLETAAALPSAAVEDVKSGVDLLTPGEQAVAETAGQAVETTTTIATGDRAIGAAAGALATGVAAWLLMKRKKAAAA